MTAPLQDVIAVYLVPLRDAQGEWRCETAWTAVTSAPESPILGVSPRCLALFDAFASAEKTLHANPGRHADVPRFEVESSARFFARHLKAG